MSWLDSLERGLHALYETNAEFTAGVSRFLPESIPVFGVPVPTSVVLAEIFAGTGTLAHRDEYLTQFALNYAQSLNGVAGINALRAAGGPDMTALVIANVYRVSIQATSGTRPVDNVIGVRGTSAGQELAAANAVKAAWEATGGPCKTRTTQYVMKQYYSTDLSSALGGIATVTSSTAGAIATPISTNAACALVKLNGSNRSRSTRGRLYYGPLTEGELNSDGQTIGGTTVTSITTAFNAFKTSLSSAGFTWCVISQVLSSATNVTAIAVEGTIATQRRRIRN
jgi:hypothetical protein